MRLAKLFCDCWRAVRGGGAPRPAEPQWEVLDVIQGGGDGVRVACQIEYREGYEPPFRLATYREGVCVRVRPYNSLTVARAESRSWRTFQIIPDA